MTLSWHCHGMRAWEAIYQVKAIQKIQRKIDEYSSGNFVNMAKVANYFHVSIAVATNHGRFLGYLQ